MPRRAAATAPAMMSSGALSPPMASTATVTVTSFFFDSPHLPAAVIAAVGAHDVGQLQLVTLRALARGDGLQRVVRPALGRARFGMASFGIRHRLPFRMAEV